LKDADEVCFTVNMKNNSWLGFTIGSWELQSVDFVIFQAKAKDSTVGDYYRTGLSYKSIDRDAPRES